MVLISEIPVPLIDTNDPETRAGGGDTVELPLLSDHRWDPVIR